MENIMEKELQHFLTVKNKKVNSKMEIIMDMESQHYHLYLENKTKKDNISQSWDLTKFPIWNVWRSDRSCHVCLSRRTVQNSYSMRIGWLVFIHPIHW